VAVLTLALGIGVNSAMFSLVNAVLLKPLPFADPSRLVMLYETRPDRSQNTVSGHEFNAWRGRSRLFEQVAMYNYGAFNLTGDGEPKTVMAMLVSGDFFPAMGVQPVLGRTILPPDAHAGHDRVTVLSHKLWQQRFAGDRSIAGKTILLNDQSYEVVGVMPERGEFDPDLWVAMDVADEVIKVGRHSSFVFARLKPGVTLEQASTELNSIALGLEKELPSDNVGHRVAVVPVYEQVVKGARRPVLILFGAVAFVLLIACANVAHLLLTRAAAREREIAIRTALGARRGRLIAQLMTESLLLASIGGALGLLLAAWIVDLLPGIKAVEIPRLAEVKLDGRVLIVTALLTIITGMISGIVPAFRGSKLRLAQWLVEGARASAGVRGRIAGAFMVSQVALALVLLVGALLMLRSFARLTGVDPGFQPEHALAVEIALPPARFAQPQQQAHAIDNLIARVRALPGVQAVGATTQVPLTHCCNNYPVTIEGKPAPPPGKDQMSLLGVASGDYFKAMGIPLRQGRTFTAADARIALPLIRYWPQQPNPEGFERSQAAPVVVINEAMARRYWPDENPIGKRFRILFSPQVTVVGVVGNVRQTSLNDDYQPEMYLRPARSRCVR
jgi:putative ABC transport system permease protein